MISLAESIVEFVHLLRQLGIRVSTAEALDALHCLPLIDIGDRGQVKAALKAALVKNAQAHSQFEQAFALFFTTPEDQAGHQASWRAKYQQMQEQRQQAEQELLFQGKSLHLSDDQKDLYTLLPSQDKQRLRDFLHKTSHGYKVEENFQPVVERLINSSLAFWQRQLSAEDLAQLAAARRKLTGNPRLDAIVDCAAGIGNNPANTLLYKNMQDITEEEFPRVMPLLKRLARQVTTDISRRYRLTAKHRLVDLRHSIRKNMRYGGTLFTLKYKTPKIHKPNILVICDVSASMAKYIRFSLPLVFSLSHVVKHIESFVFADSLERTTGFFRRGEDFAKSTENLLAHTTQLGQGTNLAVSLASLRKNYTHLLTSSTFVIVISDAKTLSPQEAATQLGEIKKQVKNMIWLNPQPYSRWQETPAIALFRQYCQMAECYSIHHLEKVLSRSLAKGLASK